MSGYQEGYLHGTNAVAAQIADITRQLAEVTKERDALRADAERYRWLNDNFQFSYCKGTCDYWCISGESKTVSFECDTLTAAIDAAKEAK